MSFSLSFDHTAVMAFVTQLWGLINTGNIAMYGINLLFVYLIVQKFRHLGDTGAADDEPDTNDEIDYGGYSVNKNDLFPWHSPKG
jgi:hypothetical protein